MSHVSAVKTQIEDLGALEEACKVLGLELMRGQTLFKWYGKFLNDYDGADAAYKAGIDPKDYGKCEHAIRVKGNANAYEVGVVRNKEAKLTLIYDFWAGGKGLEEAIGPNAQKLRWEYNLTVASKAMRRKGFKVAREINAATGKPRMRAWRNS